MAAEPDKVQGMRQEGQSNMTELPWAVVTTNPRSELLALGSLRTQKFDAYCPMIAEQRSHARRITMEMRPLFTGYLFVHLRPRPFDWRPILRTPGVRDLMRSGDALICLDHAVIEALRARESNGKVVLGAPPSFDDTAHADRPPLAGVLASLVGKTSDGRLMALMQLLKDASKVKV